ncbi:SDR family NAD(P)-dependent oxidoreductase [Rhodococcoides yunnanense]|uniref:SDR family NAD(P)-dependent oxidoreductase n=1 Tax=Rhodococcoides yunnanense TaxID=278209 RepID=UPI000A053806|nr:SDR family oxidoreductase [Rhodococcus yunnanensis]
MTALEGQVAIVTGAANGMGERVAITLASRGAHVIVADKDGERGPTVAGDIEKSGGSARFAQVDVTDEPAVRDLVDQVIATEGRIDFLDNNAAALELTANDPDVMALESSILLETLRANLVGPFLCCKYVLPHMVHAGRGSIVNMASVSGMLGETSLTAYGISKAGVIQLTRDVAVQYGKSGVRCNAIAPALVMTRNTTEWMPPEFKDIYLRNSLTPYVGDPQDIAGVVAFLASDESRYMTGHVIPVDGGIASASPIVADRRALG